MKTSKCTRCGREVGKDNLKAKRVQFKPMDKKGAVERSRTVAYLCVVDQEDGSKGCLYQDEDWNRPMYSTMTA